MARRLLPFAAALLAAAGPALAQPLFGEKVLAQPVEPGRVAPWQAPAAAVHDPGESGSLAAAPAGPTLADLYAKHNRPAVVLFFDRRLDRLPAGWDGSARLHVARSRQAEGKVETENLTIGVERKAPVRSLRDRAPVVQLVENALTRELQRARVRLVDPSIAERAHAARGAGGDTEYDGLQQVARYVIEVELAAAGDGVVLLGGWKGLANAEIVATVRQPVERDLRDPADADALARAFVKRLMAFETPQP